LARLIAGWPQPHESPDNSWEIVAISAACDDNDGYAEEEAEANVAERVDVHVATLGSQILALPAQICQEFVTELKQLRYVLVSFSEMRIGSVPAVCPIEGEMKAQSGQQRISVV
jgi:hypothetical protein